MKQYIVERNGVRSLENATQKPVDSLVEFTGQIAEADIPYSIVTDTVDQYGVPLKSVSVDGALKTTTETANQKAKDISDKYSLLNADVYAEMKKIFYTEKSDSASANYEMWQQMVTNPTPYVSQGLKAESLLNNADGTELYSAGSALDTAPKIVAYASRKIEEADDYIIWRSNRIQQFRNERNAILIA